MVRNILVPILLILTIVAVVPALGIARLSLNDDQIAALRHATCGDCIAQPWKSGGTEIGQWCVSGSGSEQVRFCVPPDQDISDINGVATCTSSTRKSTCKSPATDTENTRRVPDFGHMMASCSSCVAQATYGLKWCVGKKGDWDQALCMMDGHRDSAFQCNSILNSDAGCTSLGEFNNKRMQYPKASWLDYCEHCVHASYLLNYGWCTAKNKCIKRHLDNCGESEIPTLTCPRWMG